MLKKFGFLTIVFMFCVFWFSGTHNDTTVMSKNPDLCEVNHQPFGYAVKYRYTPDSLTYLLLAGGYKTFNEVPVPYRYRVLTPMLTSITTLAIPGVAESMEWLTLIWLWAFYSVTALTLLTIGVGTWPILAGFVGTLSFWHVYLYQNPWSTDALYFLFAAIMILAAAKKKYWLYLAILCIGITNKETLLFLAPLWFATDVRVRNWKAWVAVVAGVFMYLLPRVPDYEASAAYTARFLSINTGHIVDHTSVAVLTILWAWGLMWVLGMVGAARHRVVGSSFWLLTVGALVSCFAAADHGRMMASISPAMFPAISLYFGGKRR